MSVSAQTTEYSYVPYDSYIYDYNGYQVSTPHAYLPENMLDGADIGAGALSFPSDIECGKDGSLYLSDTGNNRILRLDSNKKLQQIIDKIEAPSGINSFKSPEGLFVSEDYLYVADTGNARVLKLTLDGKFVQEIGAPQTTLLGDEFLYEPNPLIF